ncbi:hypothetical protein HMPREF1624_06365 [Sporothrix schenckii ATCC 58251]|uniref:Leucine-rich repeat-containing protein 40 n=1 Tax=Sporothrix schenckii (strain ATCC 58251 / de Perez 2211183) TaxID=1391915 RepID=U7PN78_SPOS1|nr:hypothetical protein HMPREF1624_06365 [Sporothrix schenckii ATCC 58251]
MADRTQIPRPSGLPRPTSRLPLYSSSANAPSAAGTAPAASSHPARPMPLRAKPSRESLSGGDLRNPKLRSMPSQDRLGGLSPSSSSSSLSVAKNAIRNASPRTRAVSGEFAKTAPPRKTRASMGAPPLPSSRLADDSNTFNRPGTAGTLSRRISAQHLPSRSAQHTPTVSQYSTSPDEDVLAGDHIVGSTELESLGARPSRARLSLAERTMETLAQIPSSPAVKGKTTAFYDPEAARIPQRPGSRTGSRAGSRPGSSYRSDSSTRSGSRPPSRPRSSSGNDDTAPNVRSSVNSFRTAVPSSFVPIDEVATPGRSTATRTLRGRASIGPGVAPSHKYGALNSLREQAEAPSFLPPRSRTPSPEKSSAAPPDTPSAFSSRTATAPGRLASKTVAARPLKSRASMSGLIRKPSMNSMDGSASSTVVASPATTRKSSMASRASSTSYEDTGASNASNASNASTVSTAPSIGSAELTGTGQNPVSNSRKSSAALREQIARAKAAKRVASQNVGDKPRESPASPLSTPAASFSSLGDSAFDAEPVVPTDTTFDFGLNLDPFNRNQDGETPAKVVLARVNAARTSGRLNIAALNLREIPAEVMGMYDADALGTYDGSWAETVDLTRFVAADNEIEMIDESVFPDQSLEELAEMEDSKGNIFGGLETLDLHGNMLISLPMGLRRLPVLTSLNLSQNRITNNALEVISQIPSLRDLKLGGNLFYGPLDPSFAKLENLEIADLHGNNISALPLTLSNMTKLRILNISENNFESLVFEPLSKLPLVELNVRKNKLSGVLIEDAVSTMPHLQILDVTSNQITHLVSTTRSDGVALPALQQLLVSMNRLQMLPDMTKWTALMTLIGEENSINSIPDGFTSLRHLRHADFSSNDIRTIPPEVGRMDNLAMLRLSGNPLRDKKFCTADTDDIKETLAARLEPEPDMGLGPGEEGFILNPQSDGTPNEMNDELRDAVTELSTKTGAHGPQRRRRLSGASAGERGDDDRDDSRSDDEFATPPTSLPHSPARSRSQTVSNQLWAVKKGGVLDRSETEASSLHPVISSRVAQEHTIYEIYLQKNLFTALPDALSFFAATLTTLSLSKNQLKGEAYFGDAAASDGLELPVLKELNLSCNHITSLGPLVKCLRAPRLQKLDVSMNRVSSLPADTQLRDAFPALTVLLAGNNHLAELHPESIKGMLIVDVSNNDIEHLNPRIGLLGGEGGLQRFEVLGNRFRVPRFNVIERGTEATLRWLRGRVPVAEMGAWREANRNGDADDDVD